MVQQDAMSSVREYVTVTHDWEVTLARMAVVTREAVMAGVVIPEADTGIELESCGLVELSL